MEPCSISALTYGYEFAINVSMWICGTGALSYMIA